MKGALLWLVVLVGCKPDTTETTIDTGEIVVTDGDSDGFAVADGDCDDNDASISPAAIELCDGTDNNCDGQIDEGVTQVFYTDADGDGFGNPNLPVESCTQQVGMVIVPTDCNDTDATAFPGGREVCDGVDNDCNGSTDEGTTQTWYVDYDGDGYGDDGRIEERCEEPGAIYVLTGGDCDDLDAAFYPGAPIGCDGRDRDCDGLVDSDADGDGYADAECGGSDCDDSDASLLPEQGGGCAMGATCLDILTLDPASADGAYTIDLDGFDGELSPQGVYCDMTRSGGGWTMLGKTDGASSLTEDEQDTIRFGDWETYTAIGYGDPSERSRLFWAPLSFWSELTAAYSDNTLWIDDSFTDIRVADLSIGGETAEYRISWADGVSGYDELLSEASGQRFTTYDEDNDNDSVDNCARDNGGYNGGFWYNACLNVSMLHRTGRLYSWSSDAEDEVDDL
ncbi:MAG: hypothetical protein ACI8S6_001088, partial [Myxococcota bacterium]